MGLLQMTHDTLNYVFGGYLNEGKKCSAHSVLCFFLVGSLPLKSSGVWWNYSSHSEF